MILVQEGTKIATPRNSSSHAKSEITHKLVHFLEEWNKLYKN